MTPNLPKTILISLSLSLVKLISIWSYYFGIYCSMCFCAQGFFYRWYRFIDKIKTRNGKTRACLHIHYLQSYQNHNALSVEEYYCRLHCRRRCCCCRQRRHCHLLLSPFLFSGTIWNRIIDTQPKSCNVGIHLTFQFINDIPSNIYIYTFILFVHPATQTTNWFALHPELSFIKICTILQFSS